MELERRWDLQVKQWLRASAVVGLVLGIGISIATKPSSSDRKPSAAVAAASTTVSATEADPFAKAYYYPDAKKTSGDALSSVCAGTGGAVPGAPEPAALPLDRRQSVALVTKTETGFRSAPANETWRVDDDNSKDWTPSSIRQVEVSVAHLGYVVCVNQTGVTFQGKCGEFDVVKNGVRVSVRAAHSGAELGAFDVAPANPTGCGPKSANPTPRWNEFGDQVTELVRR